MHTLSLNLQLVTPRGNSPNTLVGVCRDVTSANRIIKFIHINDSSRVDEVRHLQSAQVAVTGDAGSRQEW